MVRVNTAQQMCDAVLQQTQRADALIMAAAVADYRPVSAAEQKIKKANDELNIPLAKTTDILATVSGSFVKVGFSAETQDLVNNAMTKVRSKDLDLIVANDVTDPDSGFGVDTNRVTLIDRDLQVEELPVLTKYEVGHRILDRVARLFRD
jgi:phosphopantothenoylcysteine decarboxylase/phosphopantothenate--cysteine ligase